MQNPLWPAARRPVVPTAMARCTRSLLQTIRTRPSITPTFPSPAENVTARNSSWSRTARALSRSSPISKVCMAAQSKKAQPRPPSAPIATGRTRFSLPTNRTRRLQNSMSPPPAASAIAQSNRRSWPASTGRESPEAITLRLSVQTATAFTPSRITAIPTPRSQSRMFRATHAPAVMRECGSPANSASPATASPLTWTAITAWPWKAAPWSLPTVQAVTACTTFSHRPIRAQWSIAPTSKPPAANATRASPRNSS